MVYRVMSLDTRTREKVQRRVLLFGREVFSRRGGKLLGSGEIVRGL